MSFKTDYPEFATIENHIRKARIERAAAIGTILAQGTLAVAAALKRVGASFSRGLQAERDRRAVEADSFLRRSVPKP